MNKEQVVAVMLEFINNQNRVAAVTQGNMSLAEVEQQIIAMQPQMESFCSGIYEALSQKNLLVK